MNSYQRFLIESSIVEMDNNVELAISLLKRAATLAEFEITTKEAYVKTLMESAKEAISTDNEELAEAMLTEALTVVKAEDPLEETDPKFDNKELVNKMNSLVSMLEKFFSLFFMNRLPSDLKTRESEDLKHFKDNKSNFQRSFKLLRDGIEEFQNIQLTEEESDKIEKYLKFLKPLKNIPETPVD